MTFYTKQGAAWNSFTYYMQLHVQNMHCSPLLTPEQLSEQMEEYYTNTKPRLSVKSYSHPLFH